jgi:hypothetical protein
MGQVSNGLSQGLNALVFDRLTSAASDRLSKEIDRPLGVLLCFLKGRPRCVLCHVVLSHSEIFVADVAV